MLQRVSKNAFIHVHLKYILVSGDIDIPTWQQVSAGIGNTVKIYINLQTDFDPILFILKHVL